MTTSPLPPAAPERSTSPRAASAAADWLGLAGRLCVVTGAGSGIGAAIAEGLAAVGARLALLDRNGAAVSALAAHLRAQGTVCGAFEVDVSDEAAVQATAALVQRELGAAAAGAAPDAVRDGAHEPADDAVYGLVNNAGVLRPGALADIDLAEWRRVLDVNLTGYLIVARTFGALMRARGRGSLVHIASISGLHPQSRSGAYSAAKAGVLLMSRQLAVEWGPEGVRSNAICPGMIRTPLSAAFYEQPGFEARRAAVTANRRIGEPLDIANAAIYLLSERAGYVTGAELLVDGGMGSMLMDLVPRPGYNDGGAGEARTQESTT